MNRLATGRSQRQGLPSVRLARAITCSTAGAPARKVLARTVNSDGFGMVEDGEMLQRVLPCVSTPAQSRSAAHATKCQFITIPWGNPREAKPNPRVRSKPSLEHSTAEVYDSSLPVCPFPLGT